VVVVVVAVVVVVEVELVELAVPNIPIFSKQTIKICCVLRRTLPM